MSTRVLSRADALRTFGDGRQLDEHALRPWRELAAEARVPNVFLGPELLLPALRHLADDRVALLVVTRGERWRALLPVRARSRFHRHPVRAAVSWQHQQSFLGTPLLASDVDASDWRHLLRAATRDDAWLVLGGLDVDVADGAATAVAEAGGVGVRVLDTDRGQTTAAPGEPVRADLSSKRRRDVRRQHRRLEAAVGEPLALEDLARPRPGEAADVHRARLREAVDRFLDLERAGWKGRDGGAMRARPGESAFFVDACLAAADRGSLLVPALAGGSPTQELVAAAVLLRERGVVSWWKTTYDERYAACSPGSVSAVASFDLLDSGVQVVDSCTDADSHLGTALTSGRRRLTTLALAADRRRGRDAVRGLPTWLAAKDEAARRVGTVRSRLRRAPGGSPPSRSGSTTPG